MLNLGSRSAHYKQKAYVSLYLFYIGIYKKAEFSDPDCHEADYCPNPPKQNAHMLLNQVWLLPAGAMPAIKIDGCKNSIFHVSSAAHLLKPNKPEMRLANSIYIKDKPEKTD